jgi:glucose-1-phosphate adenylyltransferase
MTKHTVGMVLAGGRVDTLSVLTARRPKSALPVWGLYRIIDFVLTNMMRAGIEVVGVLPQYLPYSLITHLGNGESWDYMGRKRELRILTPFKGTDDSDWYRGTADAIHQNLGFIERFAPEVVLIASGDHVYSMDYQPMLAQHAATGADLTIALKRVRREEGHQYGIAVMDPDRRITGYEEKPARPKSDLASLTIYAFSTRCLVERVRQNAREGRTYQIYSEIIPRLVADRAKVFGYVFEGYWQYARTLDSYYATNMDLLGECPPDITRWNLRTNLDPDTMGDPPPALFRPEAAVTRSAICSSAIVEGAVERSILSPWAVVEAGAAVRDSVIMHRCVVGAGAVVDRAILDKDVHVGRDARVGVGPVVPNAGDSGSLSSGVTVIGKGTHLPAGIRVGRSCILAPEMQEHDFHAPAIASGATVAP